MVNKPDCTESHTINICVYMKFYLKVNTDYGKTLEYLVIPDSITSIGNDAFNGWIGGLC